MHVLLIKTSSLGDVIHALAAVTDAASVFPDIRFDWVVEEAFAEIPTWHPAVDRVIPVALRRWRRQGLSGWRAARRSGEWAAFRQAVQQRQYDLVLDAQGLLKSAWLTRLALGPVAGFDRQSAREPLAAWFYRHRYRVAKGAHAIARLRDLFAQALAYPPDCRTASSLQAAPVFGLNAASSAMTARRPEAARGEYLVFLHATTWETKHYPEDSWRRLIELAKRADLRVLLPWGNEQEKARADRLAARSVNAVVLPRTSLSEVAAVLAAAQGVIAVDTGLSHLAAAFDVPQVVIYGATDPGLTGALGRHQALLASDLACAPCLARRCRLPGSVQTGDQPGLEMEPPCFATNPPDAVWRRLRSLIESDRSAVDLFE